MCCSFQIFVQGPRKSDYHSQVYHWRVRCSGLGRKNRRIICAAAATSSAGGTASAAAAALLTGTATAAGAAADTSATVDLSKNDPLRREYHMSNRRKLVLPLEAVYEKRVGSVPDLKYFGLWQYRLV